MSEDDVTSEMVQRYMRYRKQQRSRITFVVVGAIASFAASVAVLVYAASLVGDSKDVVGQTESSLKATCEEVDLATLSEQVQKDCKAAEDNKLTEQIREIPLIDNPDPDDPERQDGENQDPEIQDPENQDPEGQDPELQDPELQDPELQDPDEQETEIQEAEEQEAEEQEAEEQEPEIQEPEEQNAPVCPPGWSQQPFRYFGPDGVDNTGDEEDWLLCKRVV